MRGRKIFLSRLNVQPDLKKGFGAELKRRRMESGISQERLAELADLHRTYISAVESGNAIFTRKNFVVFSFQEAFAELVNDLLSFGTLEHARMAFSPENCVQEQRAG